MRLGEEEGCKQGRLSLSADGASEPWPFFFGGGEVFKFILFILLVNLNNV